MAGSRASRAGRFQQLFRLDYRDMIGKPFVEGARGPDGYDCYGVFFEINRRLGKRVPNTKHIAVACVEAIENEIDSYLWMFDPVEKPAPGDGVLIRGDRGRLSHIGVIVERDKFMHASAEQVHVSRLNHPLWRDRIKGIYRYVDRGHPSSRNSEPVRFPATTGP